MMPQSDKIIGSTLRGKQQETQGMCGCIYLRLARAKFRDRSMLFVDSTAILTVTCVTTMLGCLVVCDWAKAGETPQLVIDAQGHTAKVRKVIFTPNGSELVTVSDDKTIRIWDVKTSKPRRTLRIPIGDGPVGMLYAAAISPDGKLLAVAGYGPELGDDPIYMISLDQLEIVRLLKGHSDVVWSLDFSADGTRLISGSADETARIWRVEDWECEFLLEGHSAVINDVAFAPDGKKCVTGSFDTTAIIWSIVPHPLGDLPADATQSAVLRGHEDVVKSVSWSPDGESIATASYDKTIRIWDATGSEKQCFDKLGDEPIFSVAFTPDSKRLLYTKKGNGYGANAGILDLASGETTIHFKQHTTSILDGGFSRDGTLACTTGGIDNETWIWNTSNGKPLRRMASTGQVPWSSGWNPNGTSIAWGHRAEGAEPTSIRPLGRSFDLASLALVTLPSELVPLPFETFVRAKFEQDSTKLKSGGLTSVNVERDGEIQTTLGFTSDYDQKLNIVRCFTLLPGDRAVVGTEYGLYSFDTRTGEQIREFLGHMGPVWAVSPSPDGRYFLTGAHDMTLRVWDPEQDQPLLSLFFSGANWIAWTPEGYYAASPQGERLMGWQVNQGPDKLASFLPAIQFRATLHRPDVIKLLLKTGSVEQALASANETQDKMTAKTKVAEVLPPKVVITSPEKNAITITDEALEVKMLAQQDGWHPITSIQLLLDGRPYNGQAGIKQFGTPQREVTHTFHVSLELGVKHTIQVRADSAVSYGVSREIEVTYRKE